MEIEKTSWLEDFSETCQAIREDSVLLEALAAYISCDGDVFPQTLVRLSDYCSSTPPYFPAMTAAHGVALFRAAERIGPSSLHRDLEATFLQIEAGDNAVQPLAGVVLLPQVGDGGVPQLPLGQVDTAAKHSTRHRRDRASSRREATAMLFYLSTLMMIKSIVAPTIF